MPDTKMPELLLLHGPNLHFLGKRETSIYGNTSLEAINQDCQSLARELGYSLKTFQSNFEGELMDCLYQAYQDGVVGCVFNPGAYTHTSIALRDCFLGIQLPFVECHLSNLAARESFRHKSYLADIALGSVMGFGAESYRLALRALVGWLSRD